MNISRLSNRLPVIFLAFANEHDGQRLARLQDERRKLQKVLQPLQDLGKCKLVVEPTATLDDISNQLAQYGDRLAIFHFAGHAGPEELKLETADGGSASVYAKGFAELLSGKRVPDVVFLNGCSSADQAKKLLCLGVRAVIGTTADIDDTVATRFSELFYKNIANGASVTQAFESAQNHYLTNFGKETTRAFRGLRIGNTSPGEWPWQIHPSKDKDSYAQAARWNLFDLQNKISGSTDTSLLGFMCDRKDQISEFFESTLPNHQTDHASRPLGLIVHGESGEAHEQFLRRIHEWDLPRYLKTNSNTKAPIKLVTIDWKNNIDALYRELALALTGRDDASRPDVQQAIIETRGPIVVKTTVFNNDWRKSTPRVITEWLEVFAGFVDLPAAQLLLPTVLLFEKPTGMDRFKFWKTTPQKFVRKLEAPPGMPVKSLPQLQSVRMDEVTDVWLNRDFATQMAEFVHDLPKSPADMVTELRPFVKKLYEKRNSEALPMEDLGDGLAKKIRTVLEGEQ